MNPYNMEFYFFVNMYGAFVYGLRFAWQHCAVRKYHSD